MRKTSANLLMLASTAAFLAVPAAAQAGTYCRGAHLMPTAANRTLVRAATLCLLNRQRAHHRMRALRENRRLDRAADNHSRDMARRNYFDHTAPGGADMVDRIFHVGYVSRHQAWALGENIAWGTGSYATPVSTVRMWMNSPGHRANILNRSFREIGIGIALDVPIPGNDAGATYTTDFGKRS
jgi:uncharacterized protein YkwD